MPQTRAKQRVEYTYKHNTKKGRHGWLRLTPAYSVKVVNEILEGLPEGTTVLDPFAGTSTTALCAALRGYSATTIEINPFSVWLGRAKLAHYSTEEVHRARDISRDIVRRIEADETEAVQPPPIYKIERWWNPQALTFLCKLKGEINQAAEAGDNIRNLLDVAFCRTMIKVSNAAFNHQSMSFKDKSVQPLFSEETWLNNFFLSFQEDISFVVESAAENPASRACIIEGDAKNLTGLELRFDLLITSPPYVNRMSYIRELRPYMYWLGFLREAREAGELDWKTVGGTWGIATSRLNDWERDESAHRPAALERISNAISHTDNKNGVLLSKYVDKYFEDMWKHFEAISRTMNPAGKVHYIVGNSTFYSCLVPVEKFYAEMLAELGFTNVEVKLLRKRNSKKELYEFDVSAERPA